MGGGVWTRARTAVWAVGAVVVGTMACADARDLIEDLKDRGHGAGGHQGGPGSGGGGGMCPPAGGGACSIPGCPTSSPTLPGGSDLTGVWIGSTGDVWAVGEGGFVGRRDAATGAWCFCAPKPPNSLRAIWGAADNDLFVAGDSGTLMRFDGARWLDYIATPFNLAAIHGVASNDVWAVGQNGAAVHFDGTRWNQDSADHRYQFEAVWIDPSGVVRVGGQAPLPVPDPNVPSYTVEAVILRHAPAGGIGWTVEGSFPSDGNAVVLSMMGTSATDIWAGGINSPRGAASLYGGLFHFDGTTWTVPVTPDDFLRVRIVIDIAVATPDAGAALFTTGAAGLRFDGSSWTEVPELFGANDIDVRGEQMYAVGTDGIVSRWASQTGWTIDRDAVPSSVTPAP
jgi:hypothetical protein